MPEDPMPRQEMRHVKEVGVSITIFCREPRQTCGVSSLRQGFAQGSGTGCMQEMVCRWGRSIKRSHQGTYMLRSRRGGRESLALSERLLGEMVATLYESIRKLDLPRHVW